MPPKAGKGVKSTTLEDSEKTTYDPKKKERCLEMTKKVLHEYLDNDMFAEAVKLQGQKNSKDTKKALEVGSAKLAKVTDKDDGVPMTGSAKGKSVATSKSAPAKGKTTAKPAKK